MIATRQALTYEFLPVSGATNPICCAPHQPAGQNTSLDDEIGEQHVLDPGLGVFVNHVIHGFGNFLDQFLLAWQRTQLCLILFGKQEDDFMLDLRPVGGQFVGGFRRCRLENQTEIQKSGRPQIDQEDQRFRPPPPP